MGIRATGTYFLHNRCVLYLCDILQMFDSLTFNVIGEIYLVDFCTWHLYFIVVIFTHTHNSYHFCQVSC